MIGGGPAGLSCAYFLRRLGHEVTIYDISIFEGVEGVVPRPRTPMPELPVAARIRSFEETDLVIGEDQARCEAGRCLNCCRTCYDRDAA